MSHEFVIENTEKGRRYVFKPLPGGKVQVRRWEWKFCANERTLSRDDAARLWRWMCRYVGYRPQPTGTELPTSNDFIGA